MKQTLRKQTLHYGSAFITLVLLGMIAASVVVAYLHQRATEPPTTPIASSSQQDIDQKRPINGVNILYYRPQLDQDVQTYTSEFVARIAQFGTTDAAIAIPLFMNSNESTTVSTTNDTPSIEEITLLIEALLAADIKPSIKPLVDGTDPDTFERQAITPTDIDAWFASYYGAITPYLELSEQYDLTSFVLGVELSSLQRYGFKWTNLITQARSNYNGAITYAMNWDATDTLPFIDDLDFIGVDAYYPYEGEIENSPIKAFWNKTFDDLGAYLDDPGFIVHEYGIPSEVGAEKNPWSAIGTNSVAEWLQEAWLRAGCDVIHTRTRGGYIWAVYFGTDLNQTREDQKGYNILGKPNVENTVRDCFGWY